MLIAPSKLALKQHPQLLWADPELPGHYWRHWHWLQVRMSVLHSSCRENLQLWKCNNLVCQKWDFPWNFCSHKIMNFPIYFYLVQTECISSVKIFSKLGTLFVWTAAGGKSFRRSFPPFAAAQQAPNIISSLSFCLMKKIIVRVQNISRRLQQFQHP